MRTRAKGEEVNHIETFTSARRVGAPIIIWNTADPAASITALILSLKQPAPVIVWDVVQGCVPRTPQAEEITSGGLAVGNPTELLEKALGFPTLKRENGKDSPLVQGGTVTVMLNCQWFLSDPTVKQGVLNLRDSYKRSGRTLVLMQPAIRIPTEWQQDVLTINEPLPDREARAAIATKEFKQAGITHDDGMTTRTAQALSGLSAFGAEQTVALSMSLDVKTKKFSLNEDSVGERRRQRIRETKGLSVLDSRETFADIGGCENVKRYLLDFLAGRYEAGGLVYIDEIEKALAGGTTESSGTTADQIGVMLMEMQDTGAEGILFIGHPGTAKSMIAKAVGNTAKVPTIAMDFGGFKNSLVGESEAAIRHAMEIIRSVTEGKPLYIATCNRVTALPPELRRRFTLGTFFFDLPTAKERAIIWGLYLGKYHLKEPSLDAHSAQWEGWTGADIANTARRAWLMRKPLSYAARYATPVCRTNPNEIADLQTMAHNAFLSANHEGLYRKPQAATETKGGRYNQ
jgi:hypothetical protein